MNLHLDGREYATWTVDGLPDGLDVEVSFDRETWHATTRDGDTVRLLVAGPGGAGEGAVVLPYGRHKAYLQVVQHPEIVIRAAGAIYVVD